MLDPRAHDIALPLRICQNYPFNVRSRWGLSYKSGQEGFAHHNVRCAITIPAGHKSRDFVVKSTVMKG